MNPTLTALATANPKRYVTQRQVYDALTSHFSLAPAERALYERLLLEGPIRGRHLAVEDDAEVCCDDPDTLTARFLRHGRLVAAEAARSALRRAGLEAADLDALVVNTCTGYLCPGLSSYLAEDLLLRDSIAVFDLAGMGCGAAIPNLQCAAGLLQTQARKTVLSVAVEICSATFFRGPDPDLIVSNSIFADGAAAAVLQSRPDGSAALLEFVDFESAILPRRREELRYRHDGGRLRNVLARSVPAVAAKAVAQVTERLLARHNLSREQIRFWAVHPGGTAVLERVEKALQIPQIALRFSYDVFAQHGNMSSPSVLFVLDTILREGNPHPGDHGLLLAFGAGFTAFAALVRFLECARPEAPG